MFYLLRKNLAFLAYQKWQPWLPRIEKGSHFDLCRNTLGPINHFAAIVIWYTSRILNMWITTLWQYCTVIFIASQLVDFCSCFPDDFPHITSNISKSLLTYKIGKIAHWKKMSYVLTRLFTLSHTTYKKEITLSRNLWIGREIGQF